MESPQYGGDAFAYLKARISCHCMPLTGSHHMNNKPDQSKDSHFSLALGAGQRIHFIYLLNQPGQVFPVFL